MPNLTRWLELYTEFLGSNAADVLVQSGIGKGGVTNPAKEIFLNTGRLVKIADDVRPVRPGNGALPTMFLLGAAEGAAKLAAGAVTREQSKASVFNFFRHFVPHSTQKELANAFKRNDGTPLGLQNVVTYLYGVRCSIAHPGPYWEFAFATPNQPKSASFRSEPVLSTLTYDGLRRAVLAGSVQAALRCLPAASA
jgi:hypothetical protein